jgi:Amt family ammonium transporter
VAAGFMLASLPFVFLKDFSVLKTVLKKILLVTLLALWFSSSTWVGTATAQTTAENPINSGDTAFVLLSAALVLFMTPGLAFF